MQCALDRKLGGRRLRPSPPPLVWKCGANSEIVVRERDLKLPWEQRPAIPGPLHQVPVKCLITQRGSKTVWEKGELHTFPDQELIPVVFSDSLLRDAERYPTTVQISYAGATAGKLVDLIKTLVPELAYPGLAKKFLIVFAAGGNNLCVGKSPEDLVEEVVGPLRELEEFCQNEGHQLCVAHVIPRPKEMCRRGGGNSLDERRRIVEAYLKVNHWIGLSNEGRGIKSLELSRFFHHGLEHRQGKRNRTRQRMESDGIKCPKIREARYSRDGVHLAPTGLHWVQDELYKYFERLM